MIVIVVVVVVVVLVVVVVVVVVVFGRLFEPFSGVTCMYFVFVFLGGKWRWKDQILCLTPFVSLATVLSGRCIPLFMSR